MVCPIHGQPFRQMPVLSHFSFFPYALPCSLMSKAGPMRASKIVALILLWLVPAAIFLATLRYGWREVWTAVGVYSMEPRFLDLSSLPAGVRTMHDGGDPLVANPHDALLRPLNYPRIWLYAFSFLHINEQNVWIVGILFCGLYLVCISKLILDGKSTAEHLVLLFAGLSIAGFFAIERGSTDLIIFAIVFLGCVSARAPLRSGMFLLAALLKLFPLAALLAEAVRQRGRSRAWPIAGLAVGAVLLALQRHDLLLIQRGTPATFAASYGVLSLKDTLWFFLTRHASLAPMALSLMCEAAVLCCWIAGAFVALYVWRRSTRLEQALLQSSAGAGFFVFGSIYVATFVIGSNWDYRLIFLIPTLPLAFALLRTQTHFVWGLSYICCVLIAENVAPFQWGYKPLVAQLATIVLFLLAIAVIAAQTQMLLIVHNQSAAANSSEAGHLARLQTDK
jgi:hypothetical protein